MTVIRVNSDSLYKGSAGIKSFSDQVEFIGKRVREVAFNAKSDPEFVAFCHKCGEKAKSSADRESRVLKEKAANLERIAHIFELTDNESYERIEQLSYCNFLFQRLGRYSSLLPNKVSSNSIIFWIMLGQLSTVKNSSLKGSNLFSILNTSPSSSNLFNRTCGSISGSFINYGLPNKDKSDIKESQNPSETKDVVKLITAENIPAYTINSNSGNPFPRESSQGKSNFSNCTWYVREAVYVNSKIKLEFTGNAEQWKENAKNSGYTIGNLKDDLNSLQPKSIIWIGWKTGGGHVAYVEDVIKDDKGNIIKVITSEEDYDQNNHDDKYYIEKYGSYANGSQVIVEGDDNKKVHRYRHEISADWFKVTSNEVYFINPQKDNLER